MGEVIGDHCTSSCAAAADFHENDLFVSVGPRNFGKVCLLFIPRGFHIFQSITRHFGDPELCRSSDVIQGVPPPDVHFFSMVCIVYKRPVIDIPDSLDGFTPFGFPGFRSQHFASDAEHFAVVFFSNLGIMTQKSFIGRKPFLPVVSVAP